MNAHTPGPWRANFKSLATVEAENGAVVAKVQRLGSLTTMQADQRLIAAAPELCALAKKLAALYEGLAHGNSAAEAAAIALAAEAAKVVAKATGDATQLRHMQVARDEH